MSAILQSTPLLAETSCIAMENIFCQKTVHGFWARIRVKENLSPQRTYLIATLSASTLVCQPRKVPHITWNNGQPVSVCSVLHRLFRLTALTEWGYTLEGGRDKVNWTYQINWDVAGSYPKVLSDVKEAPKEAKAKASTSKAKRPPKPKQVAGEVRVRKPSLKRPRRSE